MRLCETRGKTELVGVGEAPRGCHARAWGRSLRFRKGQEDPAELSAESLDPKLLVPLCEAGETPASGCLALPSLSFSCLGVGWGGGLRGGDRARSLGRDEAGPVPALATAAAPALFTPSSGRGYPGPALSAPARVPRRPAGPRGSGANPAPRFQFTSGEVDVWVSGPFGRPAAASVK